MDVPNNNDTNTAANHQGMNRSRGNNAAFIFFPRQAVNSP